MLRIASIAFACAIAFAAACGDSKPSGDNEPYPTFQACYNDHHVMEGFSTPCAIEICCISHPIGGAPVKTVCGPDKSSCETYVGSNLSDPADTLLGSDIQTGCTNYPVDGQLPGAGSGSGGMCG